jgi:co-chaperonin GroES (HSP10)
VSQATLKPTANRILVAEDGFKYEGLVHIPDTAKRRTTTGIIVAVGKDITEYAVDQHILYAQFSGTGIQIKGHPAYRVLSPDEILLIISDDAEVEEVSA